jgi:hypothetical protein
MSLLIVIALALAAWALAFLIAGSRQHLMSFRSLLIAIALALVAWALTFLPPDFKPSLINSFSR